MNVFAYYYNNIIIGVYMTGRNSRTPAATETAEEGAHIRYVCASSGIVIILYSIRSVAHSRPPPRVLTLIEVLCRPVY